MNILAECPLCNSQHAYLAFTHTILDGVNLEESLILKILYQAIPFTPVKSRYTENTRSTYAMQVQSTGWVSGARTGSLDDSVVEKPQSVTLVKRLNVCTESVVCRHSWSWLLHWLSCSSACLVRE